jgi:hypothetical protein
MSLGNFFIPLMVLVASVHEYLTTFILYFILFGFGFGFGRAFYDVRIMIRLKNVWNLIVGLRWRVKRLLLEVGIGEELKFNVSFLRKIKSPFSSLKPTDIVVNPPHPPARPRSHQQTTSHSSFKIKPHLKSHSTV